MRAISARTLLWYASPALIALNDWLTHHADAALPSESSPFVATDNVASAAPPQNRVFVHAQVARPTRRTRSASPHENHLETRISRYTSPAQSRGYQSPYGTCSSTITFLLDTPSPGNTIQPAPTVEIDEASLPNAMRIFDNIYIGSCLGGDPVYGE